MDPLGSPLENNGGTFKLKPIFKLLCLVEQDAVSWLHEAARHSLFLHIRFLTYFLDAGAWHF